LVIFPERGMLILLISPENIMLGANIQNIRNPHWMRLILLHGLLFIEGPLEIPHSRCLIMV
jgi:hypothetical protein